MPHGEVVSARAVLALRELGFCELVEVEARAEGRSRPRQHDHANGRVRGPVLQLLGDLVAQLDRQRVAPLGPRQRQRRDAILGCLRLDVPIHHLDINHAQLARLPCCA